MQSQHQPRMNHHRYYRPPSVLELSTHGDPNRFIKKRRRPEESWLDHVINVIALASIFLFLIGILVDWVAEKVSRLFHKI